MSRFALEAFLDSPKVHRWVEIFAPRPFFSSRKVRRLEVVSFVTVAFFTNPKVSRWEVVGFALGPFSTSPRVSRWGYAFSGIRSLHKAIPKSLIRNSLCSTYGYSHLIILTSYLS